MDGWSGSAGRLVEPMALVLAEILNGYENSKVEFKRDTSGLQGIVREVIAFANRTGGVIAIGVDDETREVVGVDDPQRVEQQVAQAVYDSTVPPLAPDIVVTTDPDSGNEVVLVQVHHFQGPDPVMHTDGSCYERISSSKKKVGPERVEAMRTERRGRSSFDQLPATAASMDDLDLDDARRRYAERGIDLDDGLIRTFEIADEVNGELVPTNAGLLLFGRDPQRFHPDAICLSARFRGTRKGTDIIEQDEVRTGSMLAILDRMDAFIDRNNPTASIVRGRQRDDFRHYDPIIIREALNNAIAHADYSVDGAKFHVHVFDDRMVIESPGPWVTGIDADDVRAGHSKTRNRAITRNLHELGLIEERGSFWGKALTAHERGYPLPTFEDVGHSLRVILPVHPAAARGDTPAASTGDATPARRRMSREERYVQFEQLLAEGPRSTAQIARLANVTTRGAREILLEMQGEGRVTVSDHPPTSPLRVWSVSSEPN